MNTIICSTCGCSLVRLGVTKDQSLAYQYEDEEYRFCCQGCLDLFVTNPAKYLAETRDQPNRSGEFRLRRFCAATRRGVGSTPAEHKGW